MQRKKKMLLIQIQQLADRQSLRRKKAERDKIKPIGN
jgi:hypothetical protein